MNLSYYIMVKKNQQIETKAPKTSEVKKTKKITRPTPPTTPINQE